ncbi:MAG TPA: HD domain-containing phosphohydrolase [Longimicrobiales bacterium]|nr:HD domain-containing phosphohydrolase [Longimicrobiales bacterium]
MSPRVLIVDDDPAVLEAHARYVQHLGYELERASSGFEALAKLALGVDLVLLDIDMPKMDGFEVARRIRANPSVGPVPILMVTGLERNSWYPKALEVGANDVIAKPIDTGELRLRTRWLMELKQAHDRLAEANRGLETSVERMTAELRAALAEATAAERRIYEAHLDTIRRLTIAAEYKDEATANHTLRVGEAAGVLARAAGLPNGQVKLIRHAATMHDVGKIGIPDEILLKKGPLDDVERALMREHTRIGAELLADSESEVIRMGAIIALCHHEAWDGSGYPRGLVGEAIPIEARICSVVDCYDASTMDRPWRSALPEDDVLELIRSEAGGRFDPALVEAFFASLDEIRALREQHPA